MTIKHISLLTFLVNLLVLTSCKDTRVDLKNDEVKKIIGVWSLKKHQHWLSKKYDTITFFPSGHFCSHSSGNIFGKMDIEGFWTYKNKKISLNYQSGIGFGKYWLLTNLKDKKKREYLKKALYVSSDFSKLHDEKKRDIYIKK